MQKELLDELLLIIFSYWKYFMRPHSFSTNKGSALAISLVILTAITLISVTSLQRSGIQGRMVGNIQHKELGFHATNGELEGIYQFYATQASATEAMSVPLNSFDIINGEDVYLPVSPGHTSSYNTSPSPQEERPRLAVTSDITYSGEQDSLVDGFSHDAFVEYAFIVNSETKEPTINNTQGRTLSSQQIGIKFIGPKS